MSNNQESPEYNIYEDSPFAPQIIDVSDLAFDMRQKVREYTRVHEDVKLVGILAQKGSDREAAEIYSERIAGTFAEDGINYELCRCNGDDPGSVANTIREFNERDDVHGILVFYPIFSRSNMRDKGVYMHRATGVYFKTDDDWLRDTVAPSKDVEGLCQTYNARGLFRKRAKGRTSCEAYIPCTALAVTKILERYCAQQLQDEQAHEFGRWSGRTVTIVNRSEIVGRPLAAMLALQGAVVYSVDAFSILEFRSDGRLRKRADIDLSTCLQQSSIVISGVPSESFHLPGESIQDGSIVVNVSEYLNVDEKSIFINKPNLRLVPHVGKVTVAALEENLIRLHSENAGAS